MCAKGKSVILDHFDCLYTLRTRRASEIRRASETRVRNWRDLPLELSVGDSPSTSILLVSLAPGRLWLPVPETQRCIAANGPTIQHDNLKCQAVIYFALCLSNCWSGGSNVLENLDASLPSPFRTRPKNGASIFNLEITNKLSLFICSRLAWSSFEPAASRKVPAEITLKL